MEVNGQKKRIISSILTFIFLVSFLAFNPWTKSSAATNLAAGKLPTAGSTAWKNLSYATDGITTSSNYADSYTATGIQWVQIDLGISYNINEIKVWHYYGVTRTYNDVIVMVSDNKDFTAGTYTIVFNNDADGSSGFGRGSNSEYVESSSGKDITFTTTSARYARFYTNGNKANNYNHYTEIQIFEAPVPVEPTSVTLNKTTDAINVGSTDTLTATVEPTNATNKTINWSTSNPSVATVSTSGIVTGVSAGTATITAATFNGKTATCEVTVNAVAPNSVSLNKTTDTISVGSTDLLTATIDPANATDKTITWSSSNTGVATVSPIGLVTGVSVGTANITATTANSKTATCAVTVTAQVILPTSVALNKTTDTLSVGASDTLTATVSPSNATDKTIAWKSSNTSVASVNSSGVVSGLSAGTATITATTVNGKTATCAVTVNLGTNLAKGKLVSAPKTAWKNLAYATDGIKSTSNYADSYSLTGLQWVQVDLNASYDIGTIKIWHYFGDTRKYHDVIVMLSNDPDFNAGKYTIVFNNDDASNSAGFGAGTAAEYSETSAGKTITFNSVNARYARFYTNGSTSNGYSHYGEIEMYAGVPTVHPAEVQLDKTSLTLEAGKTAAITATVKPDNASNKAVTWTSSNNAVATVSTTGVVTGVTPGTATITATTVDGNVKADCAVTVTPAKATGVTVNPTSLTLLEGKTGTIKAAVAPAGADQTVNWSSSNPAVATVSASGVVTAVTAGTADIKAETLDGTQSATCAVTVNPIVHPAYINLDKTSATLIEAKLLTLTATVDPNASDKSVTWSTSAKSIASVSAKGVVTGVDPGTAVITVTSVDTPAVSASCTVTVTAGSLTDDKSVYSNENDNLENMYVTICTGNTVTFSQVNAWNIESTYEKPFMNVRFDYATPATDTTGVVPNATIEQRGQWCTYSQLKSYKISLNSGAPLYKGRDQVLINKHPWDLTKMRNKLAFDLMKLFPGVFALKTQFCHVYIRDLNSSDKSYKDYGLFTRIEDVGKAYLETRGIERTMYMYKAEDFKFRLYPALKSETDPTYNLDEFEKVVEVKGIEQHARFLEMLNAVNSTQNINDVIAKYFDRDNYINWLATNCLLSNTDTTSGNFYLFSPVDQDKWYFIPWDFDDSLGYYDQLGSDNSDVPPWKKDGAEMYAEVVLTRKFLKDPQNVADLTAKIEQLSTIANKTLVSQKIDTFYNVTNALVTRNPDLILITDPEEIGTNVTTYRNEVQRLKNVLDIAKQNYYNGLQKPMPVLLNEVQQVGSSCTFSWDSFDFQGDSLKYRFVLARDVNFSNVVTDRSNLTDSSLTLNLSAGTYYWKVTVTDSKGHTQIATSIIYRENDNDVFGVKQAVIK